jgi:hypothetical protein
MSNSCACLALYGCEERLTAQTWLGVAERYFQYLGVSPTLCVVTFTSGRTRTFHWNVGRLRVEDISGVETLFCSADLPHNRDLLQWEAATSWVRPAHSSLPTVFFGYRQHLGPFSITGCMHLSRLASLHSTIGYGIGYEHDGRMGPEAYAHGLEVQFADFEVDSRESKRLSLWWRECSAPRVGEPSRFRHLRGMIRDVYPVSVLSPVHLAQEVGQRNFGEWIGAATTRGTLTQIGGGNSLWAIPAGGIPAVRAELKAAGLIIADESVTERTVRSAQAPSRA